MDSAPPVFDFKKLKPVTMTVIASFDVKELNLPAIFAFLPVTDRGLPSNYNFQRKQGKIRLPPELNTPGEILSMRYNGQVRGIVRSENARSFPHSIIIDIGTSERIISVKLAPTIELTGPTSYEIAREATQSLLEQVKRCQQGLEFIRNHKALARQLKDRFIREQFHLSENQDDDKDINNSKDGKDGKDEEDKDSRDVKNEKRILEFFKLHTRGYSQDRIGEFLDFMINFDRNLYIGSLEITDLTSDMTNIHFKLGYPINQAALAQVMDAPPFECPYNNIKKCTSVDVCYHYKKRDRNTGQLKPARHTIQVNKSGHVKYSGPSPEAMEPIYYAFMQRIIGHYDQIKSAERGRYQIRIGGKCKAFSLQEFQELLEEERQFRDDVVQGNVPMPSDTNLEEENEEKEEEIEIIPPTVYTRREPEAPVLEFDYQPIIM